MAKLAATESAQRVIDASVQLHGGMGVTHGHIVERLYRDIRALRIYEGATEVQRLIIGREILKGDSKGDSARARVGRAHRDPDAERSPLDLRGTHRACQPDRARAR